MSEPDEPTNLVLEHLRGIREELQKRTSAWTGLKRSSTITAARLRSSSMPSPSLLRRVRNTRICLSTIRRSLKLSRARRLSSKKTCAPSGAGSSGSRSYCARESMKPPLAEAQTWTSLARWMAISAICSQRRTRRSGRAARYARGGPAGDQRIAHPWQIPLFARKARRRAPHPRDRHAWRLQRDLAWPGTSRGWPQLDNARNRSAAREDRAPQSCPRNAAWDGRGPRRPGA